MTSHTEFNHSKFSVTLLMVSLVVENPTVRHVTCLTSSDFSHIFTRVQGQSFIVREDVTRDVPNLVNEVPRRIHFLVRETHVLPWCRTVWKEPTDASAPISISIGSIPLPSDFRILVSFARHGYARYDILKWLASCEFQWLEDHTRHPEEDDVAPVTKYWSWEVTFEVFCFHIRPAYGWRWPEGRTEPSIHTSSPCFHPSPLVLLHQRTFHPQHCTRWFGDPTKADVK